MPPKIKCDSKMSNNTSNKWKRISPSDHSLILQMSEEGKSTRKIASAMRISNSTVSRIVRQKHQTPATPTPRQRQQRKRKPRTVKDSVEESTPKFRKKPCAKQELSVEQRASIVALHKEGLATRYIASKVQVAQSTVIKCVQRFMQTSSNNDRLRPGRPRITSQREDKFIVVTSKRQRTLTAPSLREEINGLRSTPLSVTTVRRRLLEVGLKGRVAAKKPLLREANRLKRLKWAQDHEKWNTSQWSKVLWSDESKFDLFSTKRRVFVRRLQGERMNKNCVVPTVKHGGGSVLVWGSFSGKRVGDLVKIEGILNKEGYLKILQENAVPNGIDLVGPGFIFQQDNDPKHSSKLCRGYVNGLEEEGQLVNMVWPAQSPDLNPIELLWDELDREVRKMRPLNHKHLWHCLQECWSKINETTLMKLINRMPRICKAVIKAEGGYFEEAKI